MQLSKWVQKINLVVWAPKGLDIYCLQKNKNILRKQNKKDLI